MTEVLAARFADGANAEADPKVKARREMIEVFMIVVFGLDEVLLLDVCCYWLLSNNHLQMDVNSITRLPVPFASTSSWIAC
jgi:hypothetical protein